MKNKMKNKMLASAVLLALSTTLYAQENIELGDIVVTATRTAQPREALIADVSVINRETIQRSGQSTLVELLQTQPGLEINNNGGVGKTSGIFLRGAKSTQTLILIDGMRVQSATAGTTTVENLPLAQIDRIEILRGPASNLYGQDAVGGVIQIFTKKGSAGAQQYANVGFGRYDTAKASAGVNGTYQKTQYALDVSYENTDGFSALDNNNVNLDDDDSYRNVSVSGQLTQTLAEGHTLGVSILNSEGDTQFDNRFNGTDFDSRAEMKQQVLSVLSANQITANWLSKFRIGYTVDKLKSTDEFGAPIASRFDTTQRQINWQNDVKLDVGTLTLMFDRLEEEVDSNLQETGADSNFTNTKRINNGYVLSYLANIDAHTIHASYRQDRNSSFGTQHTGGLAYGYQFTDAIRAYVSGAKAFRAPTFNDLYFPSYFGFATSNPDLSPEKSRNIEASVHYELDNTSLSLTAYRNKVRDLIALDQNFLPFNANEAILKGLTVSAKHVAGPWQINASADIQSPKTEDTDTLLVRRAQRIAKVNLAYQGTNWRVGSELMLSSHRYNDPANAQRLAGYGLLNLTADYSINSQWKLQARLNNALNKEYVLAMDGNTPYNTAGSNLFVNLRWDSN